MGMGRAKDDTEIFEDCLKLNKPRVISLILRLEMWFACVIHPDLLPLFFLKKRMQPNIFAQ